MMVYLIGSLRNPEIPSIAAKLREAGHEVFDDWYAAGPNADDCFRDYEKVRGRTYEEALRESLVAKHIFEFDYRHLSRADAGILILPAGKSGHLELGWLKGRGKGAYILLDSPERWDVMYLFADKITTDLRDILEDLKLTKSYKCPTCGAFPYDRQVGS